MHVLIIFRRLYNFFPKYRKSLQDPMLAIFVSVLKNYKQVAEKSKTGASEYQQKQLQIMQKVYESTQLFINYLMESKFTDPEFKEKIESRESLKFYLLEQNRNKFNENINKGLKEMKYLLKPMQFKTLVAEFGHMNIAEIQAGSAFCIPLDIREAGSILCLNFQTQEFDIEFGLYKAHETSCFQSKEKEQKEKKGPATQFSGPQLTYTHPIYRPSRFDSVSSATQSLPSFQSLTASKAGSGSYTGQQAMQQEQNKPASEVGLRQIIEPKVIQDCSQKPVKITYRIEKAGFYNVVFSNEHSWYGTKILKYRWCVLVPSERPEKPKPEAKPTAQFPPKDGPEIGLLDIFGESTASKTKPEDSGSDREKEISGSQIQLDGNLDLHSYQAPATSSNFDFMRQEDLLQLSPSANTTGPSASQPLGTVLTSEQEIQTVESGFDSGLLSEMRAMPTPVDALKPTLGTVTKIMHPAFRPDTLAFQHQHINVDLIPTVKACCITYQEESEKGSSIMKLHKKTIDLSAQDGDLKITEAGSPPIGATIAEIVRSRLSSAAEGAALESLELQ